MIKPLGVRPAKAGQERPAPPGSAQAARATAVRAARAAPAPAPALAAAAARHRSPPPPDTWKEHWFEHDQLLKLADYNDTVAIYVDDDVDRSTIGWLTGWSTDVWNYTIRTYGPMGTDRLFLIFHQGKYGGGHPSTYFDESHDFRNVSDVGPGPWSMGPTTSAIPSHEIGHIVEIASRGVHGSPAFGLWGDSKWAEFYQYDLYLGIGDTATATQLFDKFTNGTDNFPRAGTHWFKDWFYPPLA